MKKLIFLMGIALFALSPFFVSGQLLDPVEYRIIEVPDTVKAGEPFDVIVEASIDENWHLYSILNDFDAGPYPTQFSTASSNMEIAGEVEESEAEIAFDPNFETNLGWHSNSAQFTIPVAFGDKLQGSQNILLEVLYQVCDDRSCLPPKLKQVEAKIFLAGVSDSPYEAVSEGNSGMPVAAILEYFWLIITTGLTFFFVYFLVRKNFSNNSSEE